MAFRVQIGPNHRDSALRNRAAQGAKQGAITFFLFEQRSYFLLKKGENHIENEGERQDFKRIPQGIARKISNWFPSHVFIILSLSSLSSWMTFSASVCIIVKAGNLWAKKIAITNATAVTKKAALPAGRSRNWSPTKEAPLKRALPSSRAKAASAKAWSPRFWPLPYSERATKSRS